MRLPPLVKWMSLLAILAIVAAMASRASALGQEITPEPWSDPNLKITRGLTLWLDGGRLNRARAAHGLPTLADGDPVPAWYDASGHHNDLGQAEPDRQPRYHENALRFDGQKTFLTRDQKGAALDEATLFLVVAPFANSGSFHALLAMHATGQFDYTSGMTVDLGPGYTAQFSTLNVEGRGFGGAANLLRRPAEFGAIRRLAIACKTGNAGVTLEADGQPSGERARTPGVLAADRLLVGARYYGSPLELRGFLDGDILEILLYDRALEPAEYASVQSYLSDRYGNALPRQRPGLLTSGKPLVTVSEPPEIQMLVDGFVAREIPVELSNLNNIRYRPDGKLVALAYDGNIYLLADTDRDGLEDRATLFYENKGSLTAPIGMDLTRPGDAHGQGVYVASKGKISLIADTDGDDVADREREIASGWKELPHGVDALGVAVGERGEVYFGLGTTNFTNPYVLDGGNPARYQISDEHGTIERIEPDFQSRQIIATGIRFPVALAFNRLGDLFATDQEGATWLANGNPFDELLHIQSGRHYGFPPRHPTHLPGVIDEPSVFDYVPQHQSACGLCFNEPVNGGPAFGPEFWAGDALVAGYSRGKLYRTKLVKTNAGYVASNQLIAVLDRLTVDACVSPAGNLVIATHSGLPDWGSGPKGKGRLYQVREASPAVPRPVVAWAAGPQEVRVAFDRPIAPALLRGLAKGVSIEFGAYVQPGDRFETLRPGYEAVSRQLATPRFELPVLATSVSADGRVLLLNTGPHNERASFAITLPALEGPDVRTAREDGLSRYLQTDIGYDLAGVAGTWTNADGQVEWSGWLPHVDPAVARDLLRGSSEHDALWPCLERPGRLRLQTLLDLRSMLRPLVQPGSTLDYQLPAESVEVRIEGSRPIAITAPRATLDPSAGHPPGRLTLPAEDRLPVTIELETGPETRLSIAWSTAEDHRERAFPLRRFLLPWVPDRAAPELLVRTIPELEGGRWARGRALFYGETARCSTCHKVGGRGGEIGPDLSNLVHRDYESVVRDIQAPSAAINPDYVAHTVALSDGRVLQGTLQTNGESLTIADTNGNRTQVPRADVEAATPSPVSIMPEGLDRTLGADAFRDLLTFLLTDPLGPAPLADEGAPPPRKRAEVAAAMADSQPPAASPRPLRVVLVGGPKDHGPGEHDYPAWLERWSKLLALDASLSVETCERWPSADQLETADLIVMYNNNPSWSTRLEPQLDAYLERGGGLVLIHYAVDGHESPAALARRIGLAWQGGKSAFRHGKLVVDLAGGKHPITRNLDRLQLIDESYWNLVGDPAAVEVIGSGAEDGQPRPLFWTRSVGKGRVFVSIPGHYTWTFDDPLYRLILLRGMAWSAGEPVDRFNELTTIGARISD